MALSTRLNMVMSTRMVIRQTDRRTLDLDLDRLGGGNGKIHSAGEPNQKCIHLMWSETLPLWGRKRFVPFVTYFPTNRVGNASFYRLHTFPRIFYILSDEFSSETLPSTCKTLPSAFPSILSYRSSNGYKMEKLKIVFLSSLKIKVII